jgi:dTDP-4-amino-4,6-dideoxygalactose transaminase
VRRASKWLDGPKEKPDSCLGKEGRVLRFLNARGIEAKVLYLPPLHMAPLWRHLGHSEGDFPVTERVAREMISLPIYPELTDEEVVEVVDTLRECVPTKEN